jgi:ABC-2 type transport system ATP-binding protein
VILKDMMHEICEDGGAILFSTHVLDVAQRLCNKVAIIREGKLVTSGSMEQVLRQGDSLDGEKSLEDIFMEVAGDVG